MNAVNQRLSVRARHRVAGIWKSSNRIATILYIAFFAAVLFTVLASLVGLFFLNRVRESQTVVNSESVPNMERAFLIAEQTGRLVSAAPILTAATTRDGFTTVRVAVDDQLELYEEQLNKLSLSQGQNDDVRRIQEIGRELSQNIRTVESLVEQRFAYSSVRNEYNVQLTNVENELTTLLVPSIDDQYFFVMTGRTEIGGIVVPRSQHFSTQELTYYRRLANLHKHSIATTQLLTQCFNLNDAALIEPLKERFESHVDGIDRTFSTLRTGTVRDALFSPFAQLISLGLGLSPSFETTATTDSTKARQQMPLSTIRRCHSTIVSPVSINWAGSNCATTN